ncbi:MAG: YibE/F family protein [Barnesiella sp.]|nr:YibE/F family protein [Barnesiella sp.]
MTHSPNINKNRGYASWSVYAVAIALTLVACAVAVVLRLFSTNDLPFQTFAALIGVIITAIITGVLLKGQSDSERLQKEQAEIFKEKLATYNRFLDALCKYVTEPNPPHKKEVIFHAMALRMHTNSDTIKELDANIVRLIDKTGTDDEVETLVKSLNAIAKIFAKELYGESTDSPTNVDAFVAAISGSQEAPSEDEKLKDAAKEEKEDAAAVKDSKITAWSDKINDLKVNGWKLTEGNDSFTLTSASTPVVISVYRKKGKYIVEATKEGDNNFSQEMKNNFNGYRRYGTWWRELPIGNYGVTDGTLMEQLPVNDKARASVFKWIDKLTSFISNIQ